MKQKPKTMRCNKIANHYQLLLEKKKHLSNNNELLTLAVYGTLDPLVKKRGGILNISKRVQKEHPIDKGYFKTVYVISDTGKRLLRQRKESLYQIL